MKKKSIVIILVFATFFLFSCGAFKSYVASYSVGLSAVESPKGCKTTIWRNKSRKF